MSDAHSASPGSPPRFFVDKLNAAIVGTLISAAAISWIVIYYLSPAMMSDSGARMMRLGAMAPSASLTSIGIFELIWTVGMVAMMFPAMIPVVLMYNSLISKSQPSRLTRILGTPLLLGGYLSAYVLLGAAILAAVDAAGAAASLIPWLANFTIPATAAVLITAGVWQITPQKATSLSHCISPFAFIMTHSKGGLSGAFRMGAEHGRYCVGCCLLYMVVMVAVAVMSLPSMMLLATLIILEKAVVRGAAWFEWLSAALFIAIGAGLVAAPGLFGF